MQLLHLSFRDFLLDPQKYGKSPFWVDERQMHGRIASKCLQLMSDSNYLRQNICSLQSPGTLRSEIHNRTVDDCLPAEAQYACRYWVHHLEQSNSHARDNDQVHVFLRQHLLHWLEAMGLLGNASESIDMITRLQFTLEIDKSPELFALVHDARRFTLKNRHIIEHAPL